MKERESRNAQGFTFSKRKKTPDPTTGEGSEIGGLLFQVVVPGSNGHRAGPRHLSKLRAPV